MGLILGGGETEPACPGVQVVNGEFKPCCGPPPATPLAEDLYAEPITEPPVDETECVVTLVHGTFAKHAPWMRDESQFCTAIRSLPHTAIRRFCWSGSNTHTARLQAGEDLSLYLQKVKQDFPETTKHFVIAHSHGGNVALYAMASESADSQKLGNQVSGVVTLATPFLTVRKRSLPKFVAPAVGTAVGFEVIAIVIAVLYPPERPLSWGHASLVTSLFLVWLVATVWSATCFRGAKFTLKNLWRIFRERNNAEQPHLDSELKPLKPDGLDGRRLLVVRPLGDEANMGLVVSQFFSWGQNQVLRFLQGLQDNFLGRSKSAPDGERTIFKWLKTRIVSFFVTTLKLVAIIGLFVGVNWLMGNTVERHAFWKISDWVATPLKSQMEANGWVFLAIVIPVLLFAGLLVFLAAFGLVSLMALLGLLAASLPFGRDAMFLNHFGSTTAEPAPVGKSATTIYQAEPQGGSVAEGLAHSGIYTNDDAITQIITWIKSQLKND